MLLILRTCLDVRYEHTHTTIQEHYIQQLGQTIKAVSV